MLLPEIIVHHIFLCLIFLFCNGSLAEEIVQGQNQTIDDRFSIDWKCNSNIDCTASNSSCLEGQCKCLDGYIYNGAMTSCLKRANMYGDECEEDIQCSPFLLSGGSCVNNVCACAPGYHYLHGRCYKSVGLSGKCRTDDDCYANADNEASSCKNGTCQCSPGFYPREYRTCRRAGKSVGDECTVDLDCIFSKTAVCESFSCVDNNKTAVKSLYDIYPRTERMTEDDDSYVGQNCSRDEDCQSLGKAYCNLGNCTCNRAHFESSDKKQCIPELGESCNVNDTINAKNFICRDGKWSCSKGTVAALNNRRCLKTTRRYKSSCLQNEQCYIFGPDAICSDKACVCNEKSHIVESELFCWINKGIGESCQQDFDCYMNGFVGTMVCANSSCSCPEGTHMNRNKTNCVKNSAELGMSCELDENCVTENSACSEGTCSCINNFYELNKKCVPGINSTCAKDQDCTPKNSTCLNGVCQCKKDFISATVNVCVASLSYGMQCELDIQCAAKVPNMLCRKVKDIGTMNNKTICSCPEDYHYRFDRCFKKRSLGESCEYLGECYLDDQQHRALCVSGKCACNWKYKRVNDTCASAASYMVPAPWIVMVFFIVRIKSLF